ICCESARIMDHKLIKYTASSAGIDLITQEEIEFKFPMEVKIVPTQFKGPLPLGLVGLIFPRSSAHKKGCFVVPGVIDLDYTGILMIQIWVNLPQVLPCNSSASSST
uniref:dUTPase-like domain-containing protein n=1 Tax=Laticauda laticaudata TaxID=8630 RepID=A0A8C5SD03_LATLA